MPIRVCSPAFTLPVPYQTAFDALVTVIPWQGMSFKSADPANGVVTAKTALTGFSWGENITVRLWAIDQANTGMTIESGLGFGLFDWGKNRRNIDGLAAALHIRLNLAFSGATS